jgi:hypothetical protein
MSTPSYHIPQSVQRPAVGWTAGVRFPVEARFLCFFRVQMDTEAHPASYPLSNEGSFPGGAEVNNGDDIFPLPRMFSWYGASLPYFSNTVAAWSKVRNVFFRLKHCDRDFESHTRHGCLSAFILYEYFWCPVHIAGFRWVGLC